MNDLYYITGIVVLILGLFFLIPFLKRKGVNMEKASEQVLESIDVAKVVVQVLPLAEEYKGKANFISEVSSLVINYVHDFSNEVLTEKDKEDLSINLIHRLLAEMNIVPTHPQLALIQLIVKNGLQVADK